MDRCYGTDRKLKIEIAAAKTENAEALESFSTRFLGTKGLVKTPDGGNEKCACQNRKKNSAR